MIVEVGIGEEQPRRYQVRREGDRVVVRHLEAAAENGGGKDTSIDWRRPRPGIYSLLIDGASYEVFVEEELEHLAVHLVKRTFKVHAADVRRHRTAAGPAATMDRIVRIVAPIPGRVSRLLVAAGDQVASGDGIVVVEAMKMENELRAPRDGVVGSVDVEEGQGVEGGALLATIE